MKKCITRAFIFVGLMAVATSSQALKLSLTKIGDVDKNEYAITLTGPILTGDNFDFNQLIEKSEAENKNITVVMLNSTGGNQKEAAMMAETILEHNYATRTIRNSPCFEECTIVFAAGKPRLVYWDNIMTVAKFPIIERDYPDLYKRLRLPKEIMAQMTSPYSHYLGNNEKAAFSDKGASAFFRAKLNQ